VTSPQPRHAHPDDTATGPIAVGDHWLPDHVRQAAAQIQRAWCTTPGAHWHENAAVMVVSTGRIRDGLQALTLVEEMGAEHMSVPRRPGSQDQVCRKCITGWPCEYAIRLGVAS
jgi:hypothetical protein